MKDSYSLHIVHVFLNTLEIMEFIYFQGIRLQKPKQTDGSECPLQFGSSFHKELLL